MYDLRLAVMVLVLEEGATHVLKRVVTDLALVGVVTVGTVAGLYAHLRLRWSHSTHQFRSSKLVATVRTRVDAAIVTAAGMCVPYVECGHYHGID